MSIKAMTWAFEQRTQDPGLKVLLLALADFAGDDGVTWPKRSTLSERVEVSERTITRYTKLLIEMGLITVEQRKLDNGANSTNGFKLRLDQQLPLLPPGQVVSAPATRMAVSAPETSRVSTIEPSIELPVKQNKGLVEDLPNFVPKEAWDDFIADRKERGKKLTSRSTKGALAELADLHKQGHDLKAVIWQSIRKGWTSFYPVKGAGLADTDWTTTPEGIVRKGQEISLAVRPNEPLTAYRDRIRQKLENRT